MTGKYYDHGKGFVIFCGESEDKDEDKTNRKKTKIANLSHCVMESAEKQVGYTLDDSDSDDNSILFLNQGTFLLLLDLRAVAEQALTK